MKNNVTKNQDIVGKGNCFANLTIINRTKICNALAVLCLVLFVSLSYMLFDVKANDAGDDSNYIQMAYNLWHYGQFPGFQGPLYPIMLSPFVGAFGVNLVLLKSLSCFFLTAFIFMCYVNFRKALPIGLLLVVILFLSVNRSIIYYASQTFSESLYVLFTALLLFFFNKYFIEWNSTKSNKSLIFHHFVVALFILGCFLIRTAGIACLGAVLAYFFLYRQWKNLLYISISFVSVFIAYSLLKTAAFPNVDALQFSSQLKILAQKDAYNVTNGYEDLGGFVKRFWENSEQYLGGHLMVILGLKPTDYTQGILQKEGLRPITIFVYIIIAASLWFSYKKSKLIFFAALLSVIGMMISFFFLQVRWNQDRLILIHVPYLIVLFAFSFYQFFNKKNIIGVVKWGPYLFLAVVVIANLKRTSTAVSDFSEERSEVAAGRILYGFTTDFENYILMSAWAARNVGKDTMIAVRKPSISFVYGQRPFFGIYSVPTMTEAKVLGYKVEKGMNKYTVSLQTLGETNTSEMFKRYLKYANFLVSWKMSRTILAQQANLNEPLNTVLFSVPDSLTRNFEKSANDLKVAYDTSTQVVFAKMHNLQREPSAYSFKELLVNLKTNNVHYIILASLRSKPSEKTGDIITTLHSYVNILELRYPGLFTLEKTIGNDESASLLKINYSIIDMR